MKEKYYCRSHSEQNEEKDSICVNQGLSDLRPCEVMVDMCYLSSPVITGPLTLSNFIYLVSLPVSKSQ